MGKFISLILIFLVALFFFRSMRNLFSAVKNSNTSDGQKTSSEQKIKYNSTAPKEKIFDKNEGEYVDFEEVK